MHEINSWKSGQNNVTKEVESIGGGGDILLAEDVNAPAQ
jgi:hypothetical protein